MPASDYTERINRALDYIRTHLDEPLSLEVVARVACFSPFHFHRIFRLSTGEPLNATIKRFRLERAVSLMTQPGRASRRRRSLTEIALACGFQSSSDFTRSFKQHFGTPPSRFDGARFRETRRAEWQEKVAGAAQRHMLDGLPPGENPDGFVAHLRSLPARTVAYLRVTDSYREGAVTRASARLLAWAEARGLADGQWLGYTWDDPEIVATAQCRYDVAVEVPPQTARPEADVGRMTFPPLRVAELTLRGGIDLEMRALDWLYGTWLPTSGWVPSDHPCFEAWIGRPFAHGAEHFELRLQLPVVPSGPADTQGGP